MPKGGARTTSGPAPDPNALRRDRDKGEWTILPMEGRGDAPPPPWPLEDLSPRETKLWNDHWRKPQAIMWERNGQEYEVAMYVRTLAQAEMFTAAVTLRTLVRQQMDALGLTVPGLRANRWVIPRDEVRTKRVENSAQIAQPRQSSRDRLKAIAGGKSA